MAQSSSTDPDSDYSDYSKNVSLSTLDREGFSYIEELIRNDDVCSLESLIDVRSDVINMRNGDKETPFIWAGRYGTVPMLEMLAKRGADVRAQTMYNGTALLCAVEKHNLTTTEWLCQHHRELLEVKDNWGWTPLHRAACEGTLQILNVLLSHHADVTVVNNYNRTPLSYARGDNYTQCISALEQYMRDQGIKESEADKIKP